MSVFPPKTSCSIPTFLLLRLESKSTIICARFIYACKDITEYCPRSYISGGISNVSFSFRGNNPVREAMHSVFLFHAIREGLSMGIVNAGQLAIYESIDTELRELVEDVILNRRDDATERLVDIAPKNNVDKEEDDTTVAEWRNGTFEERWPMR